MRTSLPSKWFRMYAEFAHDPKVQMLSEIDQRRYMMLLCLRCGNGDVTLHETEVAFQLRISDEEWSQTKAILLSKNLIDNDNKPTAWDKRQYASDSSAERVAKHRNAKKHECNGDVTLQKRQVEAEAEAEKPISAEKSALIAGFDEFWLSYPKKVGKGAAEKAWGKAKVNGHLSEVLKSIESQKRSDQWTRDGGQYIPNPATWINQRRWEDGEPESQEAKRDWI